MPASLPSTRTSARLDRLRRLMVEKRLDAYLVQNRMDQYWLTGFTGEDGQVLVTHKQVVLLTDGRFSHNADTEAPWARKILRVKRAPDATAKEIKRSRVSRVGYDPNQMNVAWFTALTKEMKPAKLVAASAAISAMRACKDSEEVAAIRRAVVLAEQVFKRVRPEIRAGMTEAQVAARISFEIQSAGGDGSAFAPIVAVGGNAALPHHSPGTRPVSQTDCLLIDWGARLDWYVSDLTRTFWLGSIPEALERVYAVVRDAHDAGIAAARAGAKASAVDKAARDLIHKSGFGKQFNHALGHGIGLDVHESPRLGKRSDDRLQAGMVVTIEPGVYLPDVGGVRIESDVLITDSGCERLSTLPY